MVAIFVDFYSVAVLIVTDHVVVGVVLNLIAVVVVPDSLPLALRSHRLIAF